MPASAFRQHPSFVWKLGLAIVLVAAGDRLFFGQGLLGGHIGLYALGLLAALVAGNHAVRRDPRAWIALAAAGVFALALVYDASLLAWTLFWIAATIAALLPATARFGDGWQWFQRLAWQSARAPFAPLADLRRAARAGRRNGSAFRLRLALRVVALPLAGSALILALFAAANPVFENILSAAAAPELSPMSVVRFALWSVLFALAWGLLRPRLPPVALPTFDGRGDLALPGVSTASVLLSLVAFNLLFALQNTIDIAIFSGLAPMPDGMTMAQYAHRGAYPLIVTALLAAAFVLVTLRPGSATAAVPAIRWLVVLWIGQNLLLVAFSIERTVDYIESYSLTRLRLAALAWMALVAFGLVTICWRMLHDRSAGWLINVNAAAAALLLATASFVDLGSIAASWNVRHAREAGGRGVELDLCYLDHLGDSSLLPLIALEQRAGLPPAFRERVQAVRERRLRGLERDLEHGRWTLLGARRLAQAQATLAALPPPALPPGQRHCDGTIPVPGWTEIPAHDAPAEPVDPASPPEPALTAGPAR